jgi:hypothetical protein
MELQQFISEVKDYTFATPPERTENPTCKEKKVWFGLQCTTTLSSALEDGKGLRVRKFPGKYVVEYLWKGKCGLSWSSNELTPEDFKFEIARARYALGIELEPWEEVLRETGLKI